MYKQAEASFWTAEEIDLITDLHDWEITASMMMKAFHQTCVRLFCSQRWHRQ